MKRSFTKYPSDYVKASTDTNRYMKDLSEYLDYLSDAEIADIQVEHIDDSYEPEAWLLVPEHLRNTVENAVGIDLCSPTEDYFYQIEYHPDDDSIFFGIDTDMNVETLKVSKETEDRFKQKFRESIGVTASTSIKADSEYTSSNPLKVDCPRGPYYVWEEFGKFKGSVNNPDTFISDARKINTFDGFNSLDEVIDYVKKYF